MRSLRHAAAPAAATAALLLLTLAPAEAAAEDPLEPAWSFGNEAVALLMGGVNAGGSFGSSGGGGFAGGELSLAWMKEGLWGGLYTDGLYDFGHQAGTFNFGPEVGYAVLGLDGGLGLRVGHEDDAELGYQGRLLLTFGAFSIFGRYGYWPDSDDAAHVGQVGVLMKVPLWESADVRPILP